MISLIFMISCTLAAILTIAAGILSSRINHSQPLTEKYESIMTSQDGKGFTPRTYPIEINV